MELRAKNLETQTMGASEAILYKIQTTADGGARVTLDLGAQDAELISNLLKRKMLGEQLVYVAFVEK